MLIPNELLYTKTHEWVKFEGDVVTVGLTDYAQQKLGGIVFVGLPQVGDAVAAETVFADVESIKAVSEIFSPVTGDVEEVNEELLDAPELLNESPYEAWLVKVSNVTDKEELLEAKEYEAFIQEEEAQ